ncbi:unnamed protein product, partial [Ixodes persulcatus]
MEALFRTVFVPIASSHLLPATTPAFLEEVSAASSDFSVFKLAFDFLGGTMDGIVFAHINRILTFDLGLDQVGFGRAPYRQQDKANRAKLGCVAQPVSCHGRPDQQLRLKFVPG